MQHLGPILLSALASVAHAGNTKVDVCHNTHSDTNPIVLVTVSASAVPTHLAQHGDWIVTDEIADGLDNDCDGEVDEGITTPACPCFTADDLTAASTSVMAMESWSITCHDANSSADAWDDIAFFVHPDCTGDFCFSPPPEQFVAASGTQDAFGVSGRFCAHQAPGSAPYAVGELTEPDYQACRQLILDEVAEQDLTCTSH